MDEPTEDDCCHSDCKNCVLDVHKQKKRPRITGEVNWAMSQIRYKPFVLSSIKPLRPSVELYTFSPVNSSDGQFYFIPGQHAVARNIPEGNEVHLSRPYTVVLSSEDTFSVVIKRYVDGKMSQYVSQWKEKDLIYWRGPYGSFEYEVNSCRALLMISMGTGIAPVYAVAKNVVENEEDDTVIYVLHCSKTPKDIILREEILQLCGYWNFHCTHFLSGGFDGSQMKFNENFISGKISGEHIQRTIEQISAPPHQLKVAICGSDQFNLEIKKTVVELGVEEMDVFIFD